jgi:hypothetical protein
MAAFAQGLQGQILKHQVGLPATDAVSEDARYAQRRTGSQCPQTVGLGGEHPGQAGVVQLDEAALSGTFDEERARDRTAADLGRRVDRCRRIPVTADDRAQGGAQRWVKGVMTGSHADPCSVVAATWPGRPVGDERRGDCRRAVGLLVPANVL